MDPDSDATSLLPIYRTTSGSTTQSGNVAARLRVGIVLIHACALGLSKLTAGKYSTEELLNFVPSDKKTLADDDDSDDSDDDEVPSLDQMIVYAAQHRQTQKWPFYHEYVVFDATHEGAHYRIRIDRYVLLYLFKVSH